jgi:hypothetical protein
MRPSRVRIVLATTLALAFAPAPGRAEPPEGFYNRVTELAGWIAAHSSYAPDFKRSPNFVFLTPEQIRHTFSGAALGYKSDTSAVRAAQARGTIYLPDTFMLGRDDYILVHELVHHLQDESDKRFECLAMREREAYALQTQFVQETGVGEVPNDMFLLLLRCDIR